MNKQNTSITKNNDYYRPYMSCSHCDKRVLKRESGYCKNCQTNIPKYSQRKRNYKARQKQRRVEEQQRKRQEAQKSQTPVEKKNRRWLGLDMRVSLATLRGKHLVAGSQCG